jgi:hypothetical protein
MMIRNGVTWICLTGLALALMPAASTAQAPPPGKGEVELKNLLHLLGGDGKAVQLELRLDDGKVLRRFGGQPGAPGKVAGDTLEAELARKLAEVEALKKKIADAKRAREAKPAVTIHIRITGMEGKAREMEALTRKLREILPRDAKVLIEAGKVQPAEGGRAAILLRLLEDARKKEDAKRKEQPKKEGGLRFQLRDGKGEMKVIPLDSLFKGGELKIEVADPRTGKIIRPPVAVKPPPARAKSVEERLDALMRELEALRREIKGGRPGETPRR